MTDILKVVTDTRGVSTVTLNRPEVRNAFDDRLIADLSSSLARLDADDATRCVVLTGAGSCFCAGGDIQWMRSMAGLNEAGNHKDALRLAALMTSLNGISKPTIARINGHAFGGGVGLVACCDIAISADTARFSLSEVRLGLVPAVISPYVIAAIGARQARRYFLTGEVFDAPAARSMQLLHTVTAQDALDDAVESTVANLLQGGPQALHESKRLIARISRGDAAVPESMAEDTARLIARLRVSEEGQEGLGAFLEKRKPGWLPPGDEN